MANQAIPTGVQRSRYRFVIGVLVIWAHFGGGLSFQSVSPILPLITDDFGISNTAAGLLVGVVLFVIGVFGLPGGVVVGRVGLWRVYTIGWFMMSAVALTAALPNFHLLLVLRTVHAFGLALILPATGPLLMQWFRGKELPVITSLGLASMSLGTAISLGTVVPLASAVGWELALSLFGAVALVGAIMWLFLGKAEEIVGHAASQVTRADIVSVIKNRTILLLGIADGACFAQYMALSGWLPTFYYEDRGMSLAQAGGIISLLPAMGIVSVLLGGLLTMVIPSKRLFFIVPGIMVGIGGLGTFLFDSTPVVFLSVGLVGLGSWLYLPVLLTLPMELPHMTPQRVAITWGWLMTAPGIAGFVAPLTVGAMSDSFGSFVPGFLLFAVISWFLMVAGFLLPRKSPRQIGLPETQLEMG